MMPLCVAGFGLAMAAAVAIRQSDSGSKLAGRMLLVALAAAGVQVVVLVALVAVGIVAMGLAHG